jgi:DNA-binding CsgD family transcriptional regulator
LLLMESGLAAPGPPSGLRGRTNECALLDDLVSAVRRGESRSVVLRGEAGIGKTALLEYLVASASDLHVVRAVGVESEMELAFAGLHQLCAPMLGRLERLPGPQRDALRTVFGLSEGTAPDQFLVGLATLTLLSEVADDLPIVCVIDDAQWLDRASAQALAFVARRLHAECIVMVFATREPNKDFASLPEFVLQGLADPDALKLLGSVVKDQLDARVSKRIITETRGNPLALLELSGELGVARFMDELAPRGESSVSDQIQDSFQRRIEELPSDTQLLLLIAAAEPLGDPFLLWRAAASLGLAPEASEPAEEAGLIIVGVSVVFRHPLVRSVIYRIASPRERRRVHGALAEVTDPGSDPERRAWHRAHAAHAPDEEVACELERSADWARGRGGMAAAAALLARAVTLTPDPVERGRRALAAAQAKMSSGSPNEALTLLSLAEATPLDEFHSAEVYLRRGQLAFLVNRGRDAPSLLLKAAERFERLDPVLSRDTYLEAVFAGLLAGRFAEGGGVRAVAQAIRRAPPAPERARAVDLLVDGLGLFLTDGYAVGAPMLKLAIDAFASGDVPVHDQLRFGNIAAYGAQALWDERWAVISGRVLSLARESGVTSVLPLGLTIECGCRLYEGDLDNAAVLVDELEAVAEATGTNRPSLGAISLAAWRGREANAIQIMETSTEAAVARGEGFVFTFIAWATALLYNGLGKYPEAFEAAARLRLPQDIWAPRWLPELVEAAARSGNHERAAAAAEELSEIAQITGTNWALGVAARSLALANDNREAENLYREAIERLSRTEARLELARSHLVYGEWLRRKDRRVDARRQLRIAYEMLTTSGVEAFAERARHELLATGETVRKRTVETRDELTPQEEQIARLAREGLSNPEIGARLFLSPRTAEWHLHNVFSKLGIRSRRELASSLPSLDSQPLRG